MKGIYKICLLSAVFLIQPAFAHDDDEGLDKSCANIAKACVDAGYKRSSDENKKFWHDCLKPVLMGKTVEGVKIDAAEVKACRSSKIEKMKHEIKEFEGIQ